MIFLKNDSTDPYFNIALEEYFLKNLEFEDTIFSLWQNKPSIIIGKHQNPYIEVNHKFVLEHNITIARRITGGGAVYHDLGNLNFTFVTKVDHFDSIDIASYIMPIVEALNRIGLDARLSDRNSITIDGKKISGTAEAFANKKLLCHGTLLFNSNLNILKEALKPPNITVETKSVKSIPSVVANIKDFLEQKYNISTFKNELINQIFSDIPYKEYSLTENDIENIEKLAKEKFSTWDWIYGESPPFTIRNSIQLPSGNITFKAEVERGGTIKNIKFEGDVLISPQISYLEKLLQGKKYKIEEFEEIFKNIKITDYFKDVTLKELIEFIFY
jgi:lipoate-protein ligase A